MYPSDSPGGWQIIGRTPVRLYDGNSEKPTLLEAGDYVRYVPVSEEEFLDIKAHLATYEVKSFYCKRVSSMVDNTFTKNGAAHCLSFDWQSS